MAKKDKVSIYISYLLRHNPDEANLTMDRHGWVSVEDLLRGIHEKKDYPLNLEELEKIVATDQKGRYRFNEDHTLIKACQGHSLSFVEPELKYMDPPEFLYHGTTTIALEKIKETGAISKMSRHAVHMQENPKNAWKSALRWHKIPVMLKIDAKKMTRDGYVFGKTENDVWCIEAVPVGYIVEEMFEMIP